MENHSSATITVESGLGKSHQRVLNVEKLCKGVGYIHSLKIVSLLNAYWYSKGTTVPKGKNHFDWVINVASLMKDR